MRHFKFFIIYLLFALSCNDTTFTKQPHLERVRVKNEYGQDVSLQLIWKHVDKVTKAKALQTTAEIAHKGQEITCKAPMLGYHIQTVIATPTKMAVATGAATGAIAVGVAAASAVSGGSVGAALAVEEAALIGTAATAGTIAIATAIMATSYLVFDTIIYTIILSSLATNGVYGKPDKKRKPENYIKKGTPAQGNGFNAAMTPFQSQIHPGKTKYLVITAGKVPQGAAKNKDSRRAMITGYRNKKFYQKYEIIHKTELKVNACNNAQQAINEALVNLIDPKATANINEASKNLTKKEQNYLLAEKNNDSKKLKKLSKKVNPENAHAHLQALDAAQKAYSDALAKAKQDPANMQKIDQKLIEALNKAQAALSDNDKAYMKATQDLTIAQLNLSAIAEQDPSKATLQSALDSAQQALTTACQNIINAAMPEQPNKAPEKK
ncbi:MAG: hypothetical protein ACXWL2_02655 [Candidatus Chromulinivorax sp.]